MLSWTDSVNPPGTTYKVYRATGYCGVPGLVFSAIATGLTVMTYTDSGLVPDNYCYYITAVVSGTESAPSDYQGVFSVFGVAR